MFLLIIKKNIWKDLENNLIFLNIIQIESIYRIILIYDDEPFYSYSLIWLFYTKYMISHINYWQPSFTILKVPLRTNYLNQIA